MQSSYKNLENKKLRYDFYITIKQAQAFETICEIFDLKKSEMFESIINFFIQNSLEDKLEDFKESLR